MMLWSFLEIVGTIAFAVSGALLGIQKKLDIFGIIMLAVFTAVGGGIIRDVLIGNNPPFALRNEVPVLISIVSAVAVGMVYKSVERFKNIILISDAVGLGAFTATGAHIAVSSGYNSILLVIVLGVLTGVGGGIIRDVSAQEIPVVFRKEVYAVASIVGAAVFYSCQSSFSWDAAMYICFLITAGIRLLCIKYNIHLPKIE